MNCPKCGNDLSKSYEKTGLQECLRCNALFDEKESLQASLADAKKELEAANETIWQMGKEIRCKYKN